MLQRDADICAYYQTNQSLASCGKKFALKRQRIQQILKQAGVWKPYVKGDRTQFLGVSISEQTKEALRQRAKEQGISASRLASDALDVVVGKD